MLLQALKRYADTQLEQSTPAYYESTPVAYVVEIAADGMPVTSEPVTRVDPSTKRGKRGQDLLAPAVKRTSGVKPLLLADTSAYTFGFESGPMSSERVQQRHTAYRELLDRCATATADPAVAAVQRFYAAGGVGLLDLPDTWNTEHKVTFRVHLPTGACWPINQPAVQQFWEHENDPPGDHRGYCLVCGTYAPLLKRLKSAIKGVPQGNSGGTSLLSANSRAYESYGLSATLTSPICQPCANSTHRALDALLADKQHSYRLGSEVFVFWTNADCEFDLLGLLQADPQQVAALLASVRSGTPAPLDNTARFHAVVLSANNARAIVKDWVDTTVDNASRAVARWFQMQHITDPRDADPAGEHPEPIGLYALAAATVHDPKHGFPPSTTRSLFRAALLGEPLPLSIAYLAVQRGRAERRVTRPHAALIKLVLASQDPTLPEDHMTRLAANHPAPAYHCGRLLAVLESVQRQAIDNINATVVDRYYGAASATPATVFGMLLRAATSAHLPKLAGAARNALHNRVTEICDQIDAFPKTLTLQQQALFSLGFYHQRAADRARMLQHKATTDPAPSDNGQPQGANP